MKDVVFLHFQKTALVTERINEGERKIRRKVVKVGIDPHFSYANMLCDIAWARAHGTASFIMPDPVSTSDDRKALAAKELGAAGLPENIVALMEQTVRMEGHVCGLCTFYPMGPEGPPKFADCPVILAQTRAKDPGCDNFCGTEDPTDP